MEISASILSEGSQSWSKLSGKLKAGKPGAMARADRKQAKQAGRPNPDGDFVRTGRDSGYNRKDPRHVAHAARRGKKTKMVFGTEREIASDVEVSASILREGSRGQRRLNRQLDWADKQASRTRDSADYDKLDDAERKAQDREDRNLSDFTRGKKFDGSNDRGFGMSLAKGREVNARDKADFEKRKTTHAAQRGQKTKGRSTGDEKVIFGKRYVFKGGKWVMKEDREIGASVLAETSDRHYGQQYKALWKKMHAVAKRLERQGGTEPADDPEWIKLSKQLDSLDAKKRAKWGRGHARWIKLVKNDPARAMRITDMEIDRELARMAEDAPVSASVLREARGEMIKGFEPCHKTFLADQKAALRAVADWNPKFKERQLLKAIQMHVGAGEKKNHRVQAIAVGNAHDIMRTARLSGIAPIVAFLRKWAPEVAKERKVRSFLDSVSNSSIPSYLNHGKLKHARKEVHALTSGWPIIVKAVEGVKFAVHESA